jgi:hypothetical protein
MSIFADRTVVGLFDDEHDLEHALAGLEREGLSGENGENVVVLDRTRIESQPVPPEPILAPLQPITRSAPAPLSVEKTVEELLEKRHVDQPAAAFLARNVADGATLVIVSADDKAQAHAAWRSLRAANMRAIEY